MPGLSQLKKFNSDILSLGNEAELRAKRGEKTASFPIPKNIKDIDDSDDFVMGMPEIDEELINSKTAGTAVDEDFSDITGVSSGTVSESAVSSAGGLNISVDVPDLSSLVNPDTDSSYSADFPDLSMFMEPEEETAGEEAAEEPEKEPEISDLSLEDLLGGEGFDGSAGTEDSSYEAVAEAEEDADGASESDDLSSEGADGDSSAAGFPKSRLLNEEHFSGLDSSVLDYAGSEPANEENASIPSFEEAMSQSDGNIHDLNESLSGDIGNPADSDNQQGNFTDELESLEDADGFSDGIVSPGESFSADDFAELSGDMSASFEMPEQKVPAEEDSSYSYSASNDSEQTADVVDGFDPSDVVDEADVVDTSDDSVAAGLGTDSDIETDRTSFSADDFDLSDVPEADFNIDEFTSGADGIELPEAETEDIVPAAADAADKKEADTEDFSPDVSDSPSGGFDFSNMDFDSIPDEGMENKNIGTYGENISGAESSSGGDVPGGDVPGDDEMNAPGGLFDSSDMELPDLDETDLQKIDFTEEAEKNDDFKISDFGSSSSDIDSSQLDIPDFGADVGFSEDMQSADSGNVPEPEKTSGSGVSDDFPADFNFNLDDDGDDSADVQEESVPAESFDISDMEGMEFPDTDTQIAGDFELGNDSDIKIENSDFEIPGFSDVETVTELKGPKISATEKRVLTENIDEGLPPNTLSDEQYAKFLKNLSGYPLNVRVAVEDLIVKNEFTDEAEFEIIQKVLKKVPARQLAYELEKMLDIAIPVPRDFERRTSEEYEAYKSSLQYQLRNKIVPGAIMCTAAAVLCVLLFLFSKNFIYKPAKASSLYRQGYELLQSDDYPQSEIKFNEAVRYELQKKWFFKYAEGYRAHKQYVRSENMYRNILYCFNHDKKAGLEYADMMLNDLANYEKAENILLREVLDYHINDRDGLLLLGDTYLEWADEKDSSKYEEARLRYSALIQLYGATDLYTSRMMRYFIRTDNLLEVLQLKERFMPREKSLGAKDWTELSGFLLDKLYGTLAPADEYLRNKIEDVKEMLMRAVRADRKNPVALYNLSRYYVQMNNSFNAKSSLEQSIDAFSKAESLKKKDMYKYIDSYRLLGERYTDEKEFLKARELFTSGISLFSSEKEQNGLEGNSQVGKLYSDMGDIDYFISGDMNSAILNYRNSVENDNDLPAIRYKIGVIQYNRKNYPEALGSFMKAAEEYPDDTNLLLAMGNTLSLRNDTYASQGYYERLLDILDTEKEQKGILFPQVHSDDAEIVDLYLKASNNLGVTLYRLARRTGNSNMNARAVSNFQQSVRAWDSLTRNQQTLVRLGGSNLAEQNIKYLSHPVPDFEPAIYTDVSRTLNSEEGLKP